MNTLGRAGAERALIALMRVLDPEKYEISLYVLIPRGELFGEVPPYVRILNRKTDSRSVLSGGGRLFVACRLMRTAANPRSIRKALIRLYGNGKTVKRGNKGQRIEKILRRMLADGTEPLSQIFDLAVAYLEGPATWYVAEKVQASVKAAFLHIDYSRAGYTRELDEGCYEVYDRIYAVSQEVKERFLAVYPEYTGRTRIFFNIIDRERIRNLSAEPGGFQDAYEGIRLLTVGRLYYQKGYDLAVRTAARMKKNGYQFRWYVLGEGEERRRLQKQIKEAELEDTFILLGAVDNPYPYFRQADIYICTSRYEGKSIVIEEAQTLGKPVAAVKCTGIEEQIRSGTDGIIAGAEPEDLAQAIQELMEDPKRRADYGKAAAERMPCGEGGLADFLSLLGERIL